MSRKIDSNLHVVVGLAEQPVSSSDPLERQDFIHLIFEAMRRMKTPTT